MSLVDFDCLSLHSLNQVGRVRRCRRTFCVYQFPKTFAWCACSEAGAPQYVCLLTFVGLGCECAVLPIVVKFQKTSDLSETDAVQT